MNYIIIINIIIITMQKVCCFILHNSAVQTASPLDTLFQKKGHAVQQCLIITIPKMNAHVYIFKSYNPRGWSGGGNNVRWCYYSDCGKPPCVRNHCCCHWCFITLADVLGNWREMGTHSVLTGECLKLLTLIGECRKQTTIVLQIAYQRYRSEMSEMCL